MSFCRFAEGAGMYDVTPIENMFLLEYLPTAPGKFLRVYLYARMACLHPELCNSMDDMAKSLHMDPEEIYDAMTYWERQGLAMRMSDNPPSFAILALRGSGSINPLENDYYKYKGFHNKLQSLFGENSLHAQQYEMAANWLADGFSEDAIFRMVEIRLKKHRGSKIDTYRFFKKLDEIARDLAARGIKSAGGVEETLLYDDRIRDTAVKVLNRLGMHRSPTEDELKMTARWLGEWQLTPEQILESCARTTSSRTPSFGLLESILKNSGGEDHYTRLKAVLNDLGVSFAGRIPANFSESYDRLLEQGFEAETIRLAAVQCSRKNKHRFEDLTWMLDEWGKKDLFRYDKASAYLQQVDVTKEKVAQLKEACGLPRSVSISDINFYEKWQGAYPAELISYAAECARGMHMPMRYIDKLLSEWQKNGVSTLSDARAQHEAHKAAQPAASAAAANPALNYEQHDKTETNYGNLFIDLDNYGKGGDEA